MSGQHDGAPDPSGALRASDRRPRSEVLRERISQKRGALSGVKLGRAAVTGVLMALAATFLVATGWRLFVESEPPVETSIPFAAGAIEGAGEPGSAASDAAVEEIDTLEEEVAALVPEEVEAVDDPSVADEVVVHVAGAVNRPGLVSGDATWRVDDALRAAGGAAGTADLDRVNLAASIIDGQRIFVPHVDEAVPVLVEPDSSASAQGSAGPRELVDLNSSDSLQLQALPGVGPATAEAIISHREQFGSFGTVDALVAVPGIGPATLEALRDYVRV